MQMPVERGTTLVHVYEAGIRGGTLPNIPRYAALERAPQASYCRGLASRSEAVLQGSGSFEETYGARDFEGSPGRLLPASGQPVNEDGSLHADLCLPAG